MNALLINPPKCQDNYPRVLLIGGNRYVEETICDDYGDCLHSLDQVCQVLVSLGIQIEETTYPVVKLVELNHSQKHRDKMFYQYIQHQHEYYKKWMQQSMNAMLVNIGVEKK